MGVTPLSCLTALDRVRVVYPDGHVESLSKPCSVHELLLGNPNYYVCSTSPFTFTNRMAADAQLERGVTYSVCATPNAQPFLQISSKKSNTGSRLLQQFTVYAMQGLKSRSSTPNSVQSRKVFDFHSATMQLESIRNAGRTSQHQRPHYLAGDQPQRYLINLVFFRHCIKAIRLPKDSMKLMEPKFLEKASTPAIANDLQPVNRVAKSELELHVSRRQEIYHRRGRRRRKAIWKPVLQSISEVMPIADTQTHPPQEQSVAVSRYCVDPRERKQNFERSVYMA